MYAWAALTIGIGMSVRPCLPYSMSLRASITFIHGARSLEDLPGLLVVLDVLAAAGLVGEVEVGVVEHVLFLQEVVELPAGTA